MNALDLLGSLLLRGLGLGALGGAGFGGALIGATVWTDATTGGGDLGSALLAPFVLGVLPGAVLGGVLGLVAGVVAWVVVMVGVPEPAVGAVVAGLLALVVLVLVQGDPAGLLYASPILLITWAMTQWGVQGARRQASPRGTSAMSGSAR